jgi:hypothetical protein
VVTAALGAVRFLAAQHCDLVVELLTRVLADRKGVTLAEFTMAFGPHGALPWTDLAQRHKDEFLDALRITASIDSYKTAQSDNYEMAADGPPPTSWDEYAQTVSAE